MLIIRGLKVFLKRCVFSCLYLFIYLYDLFVLSCWFSGFYFLVYLICGSSIEQKLIKKS